MRQSVLSQHFRVLMRLRQRDARHPSAILLAFIRIRPVVTLCLHHANNLIRNHFLEHLSLALKLNVLGGADDVVTMRKHMLISCTLVELGCDYPSCLALGVEDAKIMIRLKGSRNALRPRSLADEHQRPLAGPFGVAKRAAL
jgi:hypothetical protein